MVKATVSVAQESFPTSSSGTGTVTSQGDLLIGSGTAFLTELSDKPYIYIKAQSADAFRKVVRVVSNTVCQLERPFVTPLSGASFDITPKDSFLEIGVQLVSGTVAVNGVNMVAGGVETDSRSGQSGSFSYRSARPVDINATGVVNVIGITRR